MCKTLLSEGNHSIKDCLCIVDHSGMVLLPQDMYANTLLIEKQTPEGWSRIADYEEIVNPLANICITTELNDPEATTVSAVKIAEEVSHVRVSGTTVLPKIPTVSLDAMMGHIKAACDQMEFITADKPMCKMVTEDVSLALPIDTTGWNPDNRVAERHTIPASGGDGIYQIQLANGIFFNHDLVIRRGSTLLKEDVDYSLVTAPLEQTIAYGLLHTIYSAIVIKDPVPETYTVETQVVGGESCQNQIDFLKKVNKALVKRVTDIEEVIKPLTESTRKNLHK